MSKIATWNALPNIAKGLAFGCFLSGSFYFGYQKPLQTNRKTLTDYCDANFAHSDARYGQALFHQKMIYMKNLEEDEGEFFTRA